MLLVYISLCLVSYVMLPIGHKYGWLGGRVDGPEQVKERLVSRNVVWVGGFDTGNFIFLLAGLMDREPIRALYEGGWGGWGDSCWAMRCLVFSLHGLSYRTCVFLAVEWSALVRYLWAASLPFFVHNHQNKCNAKSPVHWDWLHWSVGAWGQDAMW